VRNPRGAKDALFAVEREAPFSLCDGVAGSASADARAIAEARDQLLARAAKIGDPVWRERFLASVGENAETLALAAASEAAARW
jgi:hypothetical protein